MSHITSLSHSDYSGSNQYIPKGGWKVGELPVILVTTPSKASEIQKLRDSSLLVDVFPKLKRDYPARYPDSGHYGSKRKKRNQYD